MYKYITITLIHKKSKTNIYAVTNKSGDYDIGCIKWYAPWRQYCFFPGEDTVYSKGCLDDIGDFIDKLKTGKWFKDDS